MVYFLDRKIILYILLVIVKRETYIHVIGQNSRLVEYNSGNEKNQLFLNRTYESGLTID